MLNIGDSHVLNKLAELRGKLASYIFSSLKSLFGDFSEEIWYMLHGGKMLRGAIALFVAERFGCRDADALPIAAAVEFMHASSLVYDDISDGAEVRRGKPSYWRKFGLDEAVVAPHIAMSTAISLIARHGGAEAVEESMAAWRMAAEGQLWDVRAKKGLEVRAPYREIVAMKTGAVFRAACTLPLYPVGRRDKLAFTREFGLSLGTAYQVLDDIVDLARGVSDSGSSLVLLRESGGGFLDYGLSLLREELSALRELSSKLPGGFWELSVETLKVFASEAGRDIEERVGELLREL
uniref:Polyprenyl synthetase family protein n=1 Tax=Thermofilum pendens TaxID=2269 RepID=A0A7J3X592_THEPE